MGLCGFSELVWTRDSAWGFKCFLPPSLPSPPPRPPQFLPSGCVRHQDHIKRSLRDSVTCLCD